MNVDDVVAAILAPLIDANHPEHIHKCRSVYGDFECDEFPCRCHCGAVQWMGDVDGEWRVTWRRTDGHDDRYPDPRWIEDEQSGVPSA